MTWFSPLLKKTALAVVALLVLVTGATAALAEMHDGEEPDLEVETPATCSDEGSDDAGTGDDEASDESEAASEADDDSTGDECDDENSDDGTEIEDEDEDEGDEEDEEGEPAEDEAAPVTESLEVTDEPEFENHGAAVSHAATEGCRDLQGAEFGHCVAAVAQSDAGKHRDPDGADDEPVIEAEDQEVSSTDAPTPAENPGKGKGEGNAKGPKKS